MVKPIFIVVSGSHLYGIPKPEDLDLRGCHISEIEKILTIFEGRKEKTIERQIGNYIDFVSQPVGKFLRELVKPNVNFIEQSLSTMRIATSKEHETIMDIARDCISKACYSHWKGFAKHTSYHAVQEDYQKAKRDLYLLRIYYQAHYLLETGKFRSSFEDFKNCSVFNNELVEELFDCKRRGAPFHNKQVFLDHCSDLEKTLHPKLEKSEIRDAPTEETKQRADEFYRSLIKC